MQVQNEKRIHEIWVVISGIEKFHFFLSIFCVIELQICMNFVWINCLCGLNDVMHWLLVVSFHCVNEHKTGSLNGGWGGGSARILLFGLEACADEEVHQRLLYLGLSMKWVLRFWRWAFQQPIRGWERVAHRKIFKSRRWDIWVTTVSQIKKNPKQWWEREDEDKAQSRVTLEPPRLPTHPHDLALAPPSEKPHQIDLNLLILIVKSKKI